jgi:hypothetical protein
VVMCDEYKYAELYSTLGLSKLLYNTAQFLSKPTCKNFDHVKNKFFPVTTKIINY